MNISMDVKSLIKRHTICEGRNPNPFRKNGLLETSNTYEQSSHSNVHDNEYEY